MTLELEPRTKDLGNLNTPRKNGFIPGVVDIRKGKSKLVFLPINRLKNVVKRKNEILRLTLEGTEIGDALLVTTQRDPLSSKPVHFSLKVMDAETLRTQDVIRSVKVILKNRPEWLGKSESVQQVTDQLQIEGTAKAIPNRIEVDLELLKDGEPLMAKDIVLADSVRVIEEDEMKVIATVSKTTFIEPEVTTEEASTEDSMGVLNNEPTA